MPFSQESADWLESLGFRRPCDGFFCKTKNGVGMALYDHGENVTFYLNCANTEVTVNDIGHENTALGVYRAIANHLQKLPDHDRETVEKTFRLKAVLCDWASEEDLQKAAESFPRISEKSEFLVDPKMEDELDDAFKKMGYEDE